MADVHTGTAAREWPVRAAGPAWLSPSEEKDQRITRADHTSHTL